MKRHLFIGFMFGLALLSACTRHSDDPVETRFIASPTIVASPEMQSIRCSQLQAIDSLMWQRPDSALVVLLEYLNDDGRDVARYVSTDEIFDNHYAHLLLAELLYKNDYVQTNRTELMQAVSYFDSITSTLNDHPHASWRHGGLEPPSPERNDNLIFLDARSHYINGVGYYENDSMVEACAEYLKALETMESHFDDKGLVGHKARFMAYTYNRLGDMFSEQFMMESAISCYENALVYCRIEPTSPQGVSNILSRIGQQYDMKGEKEIARDYYGYAIDEMPSCDNLSYRNLVSIKALSDYRVGLGMEQPLIVLKQIISQADDMSEQFSRSVAIGDIFFEEKIYDSAMFYLEPVFFYAEDRLSQIQAAEHLMALYDSLGEREKSDQCMCFLAQQKKSEGQNKALVSQLEDLFVAYTDQKQQKEAEEAQKKSIRKTVETIVPIAVVVAIVIFIVVKVRSKRLLKRQQAEADRRLEETGNLHKVALAQQEEEARKALEEAEKQHEQTLLQQQAEVETLLEEKDKQLEREKKAHQREKEKLQKGIQQRDEQVSAMEKALNEQREEAEVRREAFMKEAICCKINDSIRSQRITARNSHEKYVAFNEEDAAALKAAVLRHYEDFESVLLGKYPKLSQDDLQLCQLYLMGLDERQIAVLQNKSYSAIKKRASSLKNLLRLDENLQTFLLRFFSFQEK